MTDKAPENHILAVPGSSLPKMVRLFVTMHVAIATDQLAFVVLSYHWVTTTDASAGNSTGHVIN